MLKKKKSSGGGANWMDTYGDMVTLLLCFFVMLYAMSTIDQTRWEAIVRSFNPDAVLTPTDSPGDSGASTVENQSDIQELFEALEAYETTQSGQAQDVAVTKGDGYIFLSMNNAVFFEGDSFVLLPQGAAVLDELSVMLAKAAPSIDEIRILGHTAQGQDERPNDPVFDRYLASNRSVSVLLHLQQKNFIDPARLVSIGYGQHRPIVPNEAGVRAGNRRVEFVIAGKGIEDQLGNNLSDYYTMVNADPPASLTGGAPAPTDTPATDAGTAPAE